jgi:hypothetical protein
MTIDIEYKEHNSGVFMEWLSQTKTVDTLEDLIFTNERTTPHLPEFVGALSKPWSLRIMDGEWRKSSALSLHLHILMKSIYSAKPLDHVPDFISYAYRTYN